MGSFFSLFNRMKDKRILLLGLDAAGKTTILYRLRLGDVVTTIPTIGFNVEEVVYKTLRMTVWDVGGQDKIRPLWRHYYQGSDALIYVVDTNDPERFGLAKTELHAIVSDDSLRTIPILVFANKMDLNGARSISELTKALELNVLRSHQWFIQATSAVSGEGLYEGLEWLCNVLSTKK